MEIGVLALQGSFIGHIAVMQQLRVEVAAVRLPHQPDGLDGLTIPGEESTTILRLTRFFGLMQPLTELAEAGLPILGACAEMVCMAKKVSYHHTETLAVVDIVVRRNTFDGQIDSFETELAIPVLGDKPFHVVFIRVPLVERADPEVEIIASPPSGAAVASRRGKSLVTSFHPELSGDFRLHNLLPGNRCLSEFTWITSPMHYSVL
jgi:5'-phosphate synthase pdxT subunit